MRKYGVVFTAVALSLFACGDESVDRPESGDAEVSSSSDNGNVYASSSSEIAPVSSSSEIALESSSSEILPVSSSSELAPVSSSSAEVVLGDTVWNKAYLTWYTSWPEPGSEECEDYNGCTWAGWFAGLDDQQTEEWVSEHNIIAIHEKDWNQYKLKTFRIRQGNRTIDAVVYDMCSDSDCDGCCTENAGDLGFLIDIESYSCKRFTTNGDCDGVVEWTCLDCE